MFRMLPGGAHMDEQRQKASRINLQIKRMEKELEETTDIGKKQQIEKELDALRLSIC
jgi:hypothetical protein